MNARWLWAAVGTALVGAALGAGGARAGFRGPPPSNPAPIACGSYTVERGDSLRDITIRAYGHDDWDVLMAANRGLIRRAEVLEIGWVLAIPCPEGTAPATGAAAPVPAAPAPAPPAAPVPVGGPACGQPYAVARGDTLRSISRRVYGHDGYGPILEANRGVIRNPDRLEIGWILDIPCPGSGAPAATRSAGVPDAAPAAPRDAGADEGGTRRAAMPAGVLAPEPVPGTAPAAEPAPGSAPGSAPESASGSGPEPAPEPLATATPRPSALEDAKENGGAGLAPCAPPEGLTCFEVLPPLSHQLRFLTGGDFAPFAGAELEQGGMITELVTRALTLADPARDFRVDHVNDWNAHLTVLMPTGVFDLGFPWFKPDCTREFLSEDARLRCTEYDFSHPVYEVVIGTYVRADNADLVTARAPAALVGLTLCRPLGLFTFDLEQEGLVPPAVALERPGRPDDCFRMLAAGEVDAVTLPVPAGESTIAALMLSGRVVEAPDLATIHTMHVVAHRSNPFGRPYLTLINRGLRQMAESGEWFEIVSRHLATNARLN